MLNPCSQYIWYHKFGCGLLHASLSCMLKIKLWYQVWVNTCNLVFLLILKVDDGRSLCRSWYGKMVIIFSQICLAIQVHRFFLNAGDNIKRWYCYSWWCGWQESHWREMWSGLLSSFMFSLFVLGHCSGACVATLCAWIFLTDKVCNWREHIWLWQREAPREVGKAFRWCSCP